MSCVQSIEIFHLPRSKDVYAHLPYITYQGQARQFLCFDVYSCGSSITWIGLLELCEYCIATSLLAKMQQKLKMQVLYNCFHENLGRFIGWIIVYFSITTVLLELMKLVCSFHSTALTAIHDERWRSWHFESATYKAKMIALIVMLLSKCHCWDFFTQIWKVSDVLVFEISIVGWEPEHTKLLNQ